VALVAARDEGGRVGPCVTGLRTLATEVVVVDDGSRDATASEALEAGATVIRRDRSRGKGGALEAALDRVEPAEVWLLADADLGSSAAGLAPLIERIGPDAADLAIAVLPPSSGGGFGIVRRAAGRAIRALSGFEAEAPLSGQRALSAEAMRAVRPLARGFGVETAMTIDAVRAGMRVEEIPIDGLAHRITRKDVRGFAHRGRQGLDIGVALALRVVGRR
jgi:glycosyltransferase involved in cell wall biosynthesis